MPTLLPNDNATLYRHPLFVQQMNRLSSPQPMQVQTFMPMPQMQPVQPQQQTAQPQTLMSMQPQPMQLQTLMPMPQVQRVQPQQWSQPLQQQPMQPQPTEVQTWMMQPLQPQQWSQPLQQQPIQPQTWMMQPQTLMQMPQMQRVQPQQWMPMQPMQPQSNSLPALVRIPPQPQPMPLQTLWQQPYYPKYQQMPIPIPMQPVEERMVVQSIHQNPDGTSDCITLPKSKFDQILREKHFNEVPANCDLKYSLTQNNHGQTIYDFLIMIRPEIRIASPQEPTYTPPYHIPIPTASPYAVRTIPGATPDNELVGRALNVNVIRGRALFRDGPSH